LEKGERGGLYQKWLHTKHHFAKVSYADRHLKIIESHLQRRISGVWIAIAFSVFVESAIVSCYCFKGAWKRKQMYH
jgi:hypothetical protein